VSVPGKVGSPFLEDPDLAKDLPEWVLTYGRQECLLSSGDRVLVAVSGGPDSVALLHILVRLRAALGMNLGVAHFDHGLRGEDSRGDADFVADLARGLGLVCHTGRGEVKAAACRDKTSLQMAARALRQQFFRDTRRDHAYTKLALGHTADDQVELFWLRLLRGAGLEGLKGMWPATAQGVVRPFLAVGKAVVLAWLDQENLPYRVDASNESRAYLRNRVRLDLLPDLAQRYNPRLTQTIWRTQTLLQEDERFLAQGADAVWERLARRLGENCFAVDLDRLLSLEPALQRRVLRLGVTKIGVDLTLTAAQVAALLALARSTKSGGSIPLGPRGLVARAGRSLHILEKLPVPAPAVVTLSEAGPEDSPGGWRWRLTRRIGPADDPMPPLEVARLNPAYIPLPLEARAWQAGDRFWPQGAPGVRKLQDFLVDAKIPRWLRPHLPLLASGRDIVWVPGVRVAEPARALPDLQECWEIGLTPASSHAARIWEILRQVRRV
jgi:tRNA(Ile)-lysidine synthase